MGSGVAGWGDEGGVMKGHGVLHVLVGPVGAGKSTFARRQVADGSGVFLDLDA